MRPERTNEPTMESDTAVLSNGATSDSRCFYTFGQLSAGHVVTGKPTSTSTSVALDILQPHSSESDGMSLAEAEKLLKKWRQNKWAWIGWLAMTAVFSVFYVLYLSGLYLALAAGVVLTVLTSFFYFSPWFENSDGLFTILAFMVGTFMTDFICGFLTLVFGNDDSTVLGCGALIVVHGLVTLYFFREYKDVVSAADRVEKGILPPQLREFSAGNEIRL